MSDSSCDLLYAQDASSQDPKFELTEERRCHRDLKPENFLQLEEIFEEIFEEIIAQTYAMRFLSKVSLASYDIIPLYPILIPSERAFRDPYTPY